MTPLALLLGGWLSLTGQEPPDRTPPPPPPSILRELPVPMRDGVVLQADVLRPAASGKFPTLILRTPYDRSRGEESELVRQALRRGYAVVLQDVRGRYASGGEYVPYRNEGPDGYDTIEWAAAQPWSSGEVGTFGLSYPAAVQWLAAVESPPHLKAMVPAMTFSSPRNFFYAGGTWDLSWISWIWDNIAPDARVRGNLPGPRTGREAGAAWRTKWGAILPFRLPLSELPELRAEAPFYFDWLAHPPEDAWWDWAELRGRYAGVRAAVLGISGWHDEAYGPEGAITNFEGLLAARAGEKDSRTRLILGPWVHGGVSSDHAGERVFGPQARLDYEGEILRFMDRYVRGIGNGLDAEPPVRAFVMGENAWRSGATFPLPGTKPLSLYFAAGGGLLLEAPTTGGSGGGEPTAFESDPADPVLNAYADKAGAHDYRALAERKDVAVFQTEPLAEPLRVVGPIETEIAVSSDAPDLDLWVKLEDVEPNGTAWNLSSPGTDVLRASWRESGKPRKPLAPGEVAVLRLPNLRTGNLFAKGHRIRVILCGSFMPDFSRNLQTGESETSSAKTRKAVIRIHHDAANASRIVLPVVPDVGKR
ncbi:MAG TPA: CocE/NonD family hydrolase [Thermoanaerobaculia bacterium]